MRQRLGGPIVGALVLVGAACTDGAEEQGGAPPSVEATAAIAATTASKPTVDPETTTLAPSTTASTTTITIEPTTTTPVTTTTLAPTTTTIPETTTTAPPVTVAAPAAVVAPGTPDPACSRLIAPGDSLNLIIAAIANPAVTVEGLQTENSLADANTINAGDSLDICVGNGIDDLTGQPRVPPTTAPVTPMPPVPDVAPAAPITGTGVAAQQQKLNELLSGYGMPLLTVDGASGRLTRQQLCAARMALGLPISRDDMAPGSPEEQALLTATSVSIPPGAPTSASRWALIDQTCQVMFVGQGSDGVVFVFPTSTGQSDFRTRDQNASRAFRFDPALGNNGWHDSIDYPVPGDNPLNGNMYKPIYFDGGQAIHGANNVPPEPKSHGCVRLRVANQQTLVDWLGLADVGGPIWNADRLDFRVSVQGRY